MYNIGPPNVHICRFNGVRSIITSGSSSYQARIIIASSIILLE